MSNHQRSHSMPVTREGGGGASPPIQFANDAAMTMSHPVPGQGTAFLNSMTRPWQYPAFMNNNSASARRNNNLPLLSNDDDDGEKEQMFGATTEHEKVYCCGTSNNTSIACRVQILCKVDRGFFKADHQWTCYRRNYFQLTGAFTVLSPFGYHQRYYSPCISKETHFFIQHQDGSRSVITGFFLRLAARSVETDRPVKLIQLTPKRDKGPQLDPPLLPVDPLDAESIMLGACDTPSWFDTASRSMVATFERIQFKSATANNGKKRATQKHFVLVMELVARTGPDNAFVTIASCQSLPLVVRGRSPGHYADHSVVVVTAAATKVKKRVKESSTTTTTTTENTPAAAAPITTTTSSVGQYNLFDGYPIPLPTCWSNAATSDSGAPTATTIYTSFSTTESMFGSHSRSQSATLPIIKQHEMDRFLAGVSPSSSSSCLSHNSGQDDPFNAAPYMSLKASLNDPFEVIIPQSRYFGYPAFSPVHPSPPSLSHESPIDQ